MPNSTLRLIDFFHENLAFFVIIYMLLFTREDLLGPSKWPLYTGFSDQRQSLIQRLFY